MSMFKKLFNKQDETGFREEVEVLCQLYYDYSSLWREDSEIELRNEVGNHFLSEALRIQRKDPKLLKKILLEESTMSTRRGRIMPVYEHPLLGEIEDEPNILDAKIAEVKSYLKYDEEATRIKKLFVVKRENLKLVEITKVDKPDVRNPIEDMPEVKTIPIGPKFDRIGKLSHYVVIDVKTTGEKTENNFITEIAAIKVVEDTITEGFHTKIDNTGKNNPRVAEIKDAFIEFIGSSPIVGFSASFDLKFLFSEGIDLISDRKIYDVAQYVMKTKTRLKSYDFETSLKAYGYNVKPKDSLDVCLMTDKLLSVVLDKIVKEK